MLSNLVLNFRNAAQHYIHFEWGGRKVRILTESFCERKKMINRIRRAKDKDDIIDSLQDRLNIAIDTQLLLTGAKELSTDDICHCFVTAMKGLEEEVKQQRSW